MRILNKIFITLVFFLFILSLVACSNSKKASFYSGLTSPEYKMGSSGDIYLNKETGELFSKEDGKWIKLTNLLGFQANKEDLNIYSAKLQGSSLVFTFVDGTSIELDSPSPKDNYKISLREGIFTISLEKTYKDLDSLALDD